MKKRQLYSKIGPINISISGCDTLTELIADELEASNKKLQDINLSIIIKGTDDNFDFIPSIYSGKKLMNFNKKSFFVGYHPNFDYMIENLYGDGITRLIIKPKKSIKNLKTKIKLLIKFFLLKFNLENNLMSLKNSFMTYQLFWYIFNIVLIKKGASFLHSGIISDGKKTIAITGTGGSGKTSCLFKMLENKKYRYLSEDFGIIDENSTAYYNPKFVSIYKSDTRQDILKNYIMFKMNKKQKIIWDYRCKIKRQNPRIKVSPKKVIGKDRLGACNKLTNIFYLIRGDFNSIIVENMSQEELVERSINVTYREMKTFCEINRLIQANKPQEYDYLSTEEVINKNKKIYKKAFNNVKLTKILVPFNSTPNDVVRIIEEIIGN